MNQTFSYSVNWYWEVYFAQDAFMAFYELRVKLAKLIDEL